MKPTPGPYKIRDGFTSVEVTTAGGSVISRFDCSTRERYQARANAEAWIAGVAAIEKLERIRALSTSTQWHTFADILRILDEP